MTEQPAPIGHNRIPVTVPEPDAIQADLEARHPAVKTRLDELLASLAGVPKTITDEETFGKAQALYKMMRDSADDWDATRDKEKRAYDTGVGVVNNFFLTPIAKLKDKTTGVMPGLKEKIGAYLEKKRDDAKRAAEAEAERKRKEAEVKAKAAKELERAQQEIVGEAWAKEESARVAAWKRQIAEGGVWAAEIDLEVKGKKDREAANAAQDAIEAAKKNLRAAKTEEKDASKDAGQARKEERKGASAVKQAASAAERAGNQAERAESRAAGPESDFARTRGEHGTVGTIARHWVVKAVDHTKVNLNELRGYIDAKAIESAAYRFMMDHREDEGGPILAGAVFKYESTPQVR